MKGADKKRMDDKSLRTLHAQACSSSENLKGTGGLGGLLVLRWYSVGQVQGGRPDRGAASLRLLPVVDRL